MLSSKTKLLFQYKEFIGELFQEKELRKKGSVLQKIFSCCRFTISQFVIVFSFKANEIQRAFRGLLGRKIVRQKLKEKKEGRELSLFNYLCIQLQKCFRGYYSRKYKHDQTRRKEYCRMLVEQGEQVRESLRQYAEELAEVKKSAICMLRFFEMLLDHIRLLLLFREKKTNA